MGRLSLHRVHCPWGRTEARGESRWGDRQSTLDVCGAASRGGWASGPRWEQVEGLRLVAGAWEGGWLSPEHSPSREQGAHNRGARLWGPVFGSHLYLLCFDREVGRLHKGNRGHQHAPGVRADPI